MKNIETVVPDIIIIGGDITYDDANINCYYSWDGVLNLFTNSFQNIGRTIPIIIGVGNHDVGMNALSGASIKVG